MKKLSNILLAAGVFLSLNTPVFAVVDVNPCGAGAGSANSAQFQTSLCGLQTSGIGTVVRNLIIAILVIATVIALFFLIYGGVRWILSGGDKAKVEAARNTIVAAIIGLIITFLAYFILNLVLGLFNLSFANLELPSLTGQ